MVKIIDWGLAKSVDAQPFSGANHTRGFVGTPAFASPEQLARNADRRIDVRSDIYSLGVTLWYLLCARPPFIGHTLEDLHAQQTTQVLPLERLSAARVPAPIVGLLRAMLAADPQARLSSARELLEALEQCRGQIEPKHRRIARRKMAALGIAVLLVGLFASLVLVSYRTRNDGFNPPSIPDRSASIAVLPFEDLSQDGRYAFFVKGVQEAVTFKLSHLSTLKVVETRNSGTYTPNPKDPTSVANELKVDYLLEGHLQRTEDKLELRLALLDRHEQQRQQVWQTTFSRPPADVFVLEKEAAKAVATQLRLKPSPEERASIDEPIASDPAAYDLYLRAGDQPAFVNSTAEVRTALKRQIALLEQALARDPNFVQAYCDLATAHDEFALTGKDPDPEHFAVDHRALAEAALQTARRLRPDTGPVHVAYAYHFHTSNHDDEQALVEAKLAQRALPNDAGVHQLLGNLARGQGQWEEAARELEQACQLSPDDPNLYYDLTGVYRAVRRYDEADRACARFIALTPGSSVFENCVIRAASALEQRGDLSPLRAAVAAMDESMNHPQAAPYDECRLMLACLTRDPGQVAQLLSATSREDFDLGGFTYPASWFAALAARMRGDGAGADAAFLSAREAAARTVDLRAGDPRAMSVLAMIDAGLGRRDDAVQEGRLAYEKMHAEKSATLAPAIAGNLAVVYAWTGQPDLAFAMLDDLAGRAAGRNWWYRVTYGDLLLSPLWDPLRADPRFQQLIARLEPPPKAR